MMRAECINLAQGLARDHRADDPRRGGCRLHQPAVRAGPCGDSLSSCLLCSRL